MAERPTAVRLFSPEHPALPRTMRAKLEKRMAELSGQLGGGYAQDWSDYKHRAGVIAGLNEAYDICAEVEKELGE